MPKVPESSIRPLEEGNAPVNVRDSVISPSIKATQNCVALWDVTVRTAAGDYLHTAVHADRRMSAVAAALFKFYLTNRDSCICLNTIYAKRSDSSSEFGDGVVETCSMDRQTIENISK